MPRWLFLILAAAVALSVLGSVLIVLRSPISTPRPEAGTTAAPPTPRPEGNP